MPKKMVWIILPSVISIMLLVLLSGCEKPPTQELANAEKAIAEARQKEADLYAPDFFKKADDSLKKAKDLVDGKKYKEAKKAAEEAVAFAQQAVSQVEPAKAKMKADAEQMIQEVQQAIDELKAQIAKSLKKMARGEPKHIQEMIEKWEKEAADIKDQVQAQKVLRAAEQLKAIKDQALAQKERLIALPAAKAKEK